MLGTLRGHNNIQRKGYCNALIRENKNEAIFVNPKNVRIYYKKFWYQEEK